MNTSAASPVEGTRPTPPDFNQKESRQFKSKAPKPGQKSLSLSGMDSFEDSSVICPWEDFGDAELNKLAQYGII